MGYLFEIRPLLRAAIKSVAAILLACLSAAVSAQDLVRLTVNVLPPYSPYIQDYPGAGNRVQVFISNLSGKSLAVRLLGKLEGDNGVVISTLPNYRPMSPLQLLPTDLNRMISRSELEGLFDLNQIEVQGMNKNLLYRGLPLPEGNYQLCIQAFDNAGTRPISSGFPTGCSGLIPVRIIEPPILISPFDSEIVKYSQPQNQLFTWSPPVGILPGQVEYTLRIAELPAIETDPNVYLDAIAMPASGLEIRHLRSTSFLYGPQYPPLRAGKKYAWRVQAHPVRERLNLLNDGKSPVQGFQYGLNFAPATAVISNLVGKEMTGMQTLSSNLPVNCSCKINEPLNKKADNGTALKNMKATIAGFTMELLKGVREEKGRLKGMAVIPVPIAGSKMVRVRAKLVDVQCNSDGEVIGGVVKAIYKDKAAGYTPNLDSPEIPEVQFSPAQIQGLSEYFKKGAGQLISGIKDAAGSAGFELPLGLDRQIGPVGTLIAITDMTFTPTQAVFNANTWIENQSGLTNGIPLSGYNMCMSPAKPCGDGLLYLAGDMKLSGYFSLKGTEGPSGGFFKPDTSEVTYVLFDQDGFRKMRVHGLLSPPLLSNADSPGEPLRIAVNTDVTDFKNWTARFSVPKFFVKGIDDFRFYPGEGQYGLYDHSESDTPGKLPEGYLSETEHDSWQGLYFPALKMELPAFLSKGNGSPAVAGVEHIIYDDHGLSGAAIATNILTLGKSPEEDGSLGGWFYSIDELNIRFNKNTFQQSAMKGRLVLPIFNDPYSQSSQLPYKSILTKSQSTGALEFELTVEPVEQMPVDIWKARLNLAASSSIRATYNQQGFTASARLDGSLDISTGPVSIPGAHFTNMVLSTSAPYFSLENFNMSTASPQKEVTGMPFSIDYAGKPKDGQTGFEFGCSVDLSEGAGITGKGGLVLAFSAGMGKNGRPDWQYKGIQAAGFSAQGNVGPVKIAGSLTLLDHDPQYGDGFKGDVDMRVIDKIDVHVAAMFGSISNNGSSYRYWYVGGDAAIPSGGIPLAGPVAFKGFGGGLYSNVEQTFSEGKASYLPKKGLKGFEASVRVGLTTPYLLDAKGMFSMTFTEKWEPVKVMIGSDAWLLGEDMQSALAKGYFNMNFDIANSKISVDSRLEAGASVGPGSIRATMPVGMELDYGAGKWYMAIGAPTTADRVMMEVKFGMTFNFGSYFVMGNYNPQPTAWVLPPAPYGFDGELAGLFNGLSGKRANTVSGAFNSTGAMLAFGAGYHLAADYNIGPFFMDFAGAVGYDLVLKKVEVPCVTGAALPGINGWYAEGQLYAGMSFALGIDVDLWIYSGRIKVAELSAGALLRGGLVNPIWLNGQVAVRYKVLRGLVKGNFNFDFWYNKEQRCDPAFLPPNPFADMPLISSIGPAGTDVETPVITPFTATFNYPVENKLIVDIEIPEGKAVDNSVAGTVSTLTVTGADGKAETRRVLTQEFKLQFREKFLATAVQKDKAVSQVQDINTGELVMGNNSEGERNYAATFYRENALLPKSTYELAVGIQVFVYHKGNLQPYLFKNQTVEQTEKVTFVTGGCPSDLTKGESSDNSVLTSYPYEGQRYYMKNETRRAFVRLKANMPGCSGGLGADKNYDLSVALVPLEGAEFSAKPIALIGAEFTGNQFIYDMPSSIRNNTLYRLQLLRTPKDDFVNEVLAKGFDGKMSVKTISSANIYKSTVAQGPVTLAGLGSPGNRPLTVNAIGKPGEAVDTKYAQSVNAYTDENKLKQLALEYGMQSDVNEKSVVQGYDIRQAGKNLSTISDLASRKEVVKKSLTVELYRYYFKTSKYNTLKEKIANASFTTSGGNGGAPPILTGDYVTGSMTVDEGFDRYDLNYENLGYNQVRPPLVLLKATDNSEWFRTVAQPIAYLVSQSPDSYFASPGGGKYQSPARAQEDLTDRLKRSLVSFGTYFFPAEEPYRNQEIYRLFPKEMRK